MKSGQGFYYTNLAREDYYLDGGEPPGRWFGGAAPLLCLDSNALRPDHDVPRTVEKDTLHKLLRGYNDRMYPLVKNAGKEGRGGRQAGLDLTFTPDKTVSVLRAYGPEQLRQGFDNAQDYAVKKTLQLAEQKLGWVRRGNDGEEHIKAKLLFALFDHETSRSLDANQHTHALLINVGVADADGKTRAIYNNEFYQWKMALGVHYRAAHAHYLSSELGLGIDTDRERGFYKVRGVFEDVCDAHSSRRKAIEAELEEFGYSTSRAADIAAIRTRQDKGHLPRQELQEKHDQVLHTLGHTRDDLLASVEREKCQIFRSESPQQVAKDEAKRLAEEQATFREQDLYRAVQNRFVDGVNGPDEIVCAVESELASARVVPLAGSRRLPLYTTQENLAAERGVFNLAESLAANSSHTVSKEIVDRIKDKNRDKHFTSTEREEAFDYLTTTPGDFKVLSGVAGSAKTSLLEPFREACEQQGYNVIGMAVAAKIARGLGASSGIDSSTVRKRLIQFDEAARNRILENLTLKPLREKLTVENLLDNLTLKPIREKLTFDQIRANLMLKPLLEKLSPQQLLDNLRFKSVRENLTSEQIRHNLSVQGLAEQVSADRAFKRRGGGVVRNRWLTSRPSNARLPRVKLDKKSVIVVDEASMLGLPDTTAILKHAQAAGAKVVMVAGHWQLPAIKSVSPVKALQHHTGGGYELKDILRQKEGWMRQATQCFADGDSRGGLSLLMKNKALHLGNGGSDATKEKLVAGWVKDKFPMDQRGVFVGTNADRIDLNNRIQKARLDAGELRGKSVLLGSGERAHVGDTVMFLENITKMNVDNGMVGTLSKIHRSAPLTFKGDGKEIPGYAKGEVTIETAEGDNIRLRLDKYDKLTLGYTFTTHKGQGDTVRSSHIYTTPRDAQREMIYVQASRHAESVQVYSPGHSLGEDLDELQQAMKHERTRKLASEYEVEQRQRIEEEQKKRSREQETPGLERTL